MILSSPASPRMWPLTSRALVRFTPVDLTRTVAAVPRPRPGEVGVANTQLSVNPCGRARSIGRAVLRTEALG